MAAFRNWRADMSATIACEDCGGEEKRRSPSHKLCAECSGKRHAARQLAWARAHAPEPNRVRAAARQRRSKIKDAGLALNVQGRAGIGDIFRRPAPRWSVTFHVPFDWTASKNATYAFGQNHIYRRVQTKLFQNMLIAACRRALEGIEVFQGKVWVRLFVEKPNQKGDAINVLDLVADGLKEAIGVDDRWFSIDGIDWAIVKSDPRIYIQISQEISEHQQACSHCGRVLALASFTKNATAKNGYARACRDCRSARNRPAAPRAREAA